MIDRIRFVQTLKKYDIELTETQLDQLDKYAEILVDYNEKVNLKAITDPQGIEEKHFLDSLLFAKNPLVKGKVADVGTGAGFPGIVTKIYKPEIDLTLIEPTGKRCTFLQYALDTLGLEGSVVKERAEEAARKQWREQFDVVTARAVADMRVLSEYCIPLAKVGGYFIAMKGDGEKELTPAMKAIEKLGGKYESMETFSLPDESKRCLIISRKAKETPKVYPRNGGKIAKAPL
ncbi:MAG: 16S rRNA (guanine(527)-N(7))-methyltransferase RsmG [Oscillospiraceae bacterium]|nr:16S rRNA (guanine(527)-N(7))-methyltransferase RsmG [Oscillospiraceae bacterium]